MTKEEYAKIYAYDALLSHLEIAINDPRKREKVRARIAKSHMLGWYKEGVDEYETRNTK